MNPFRSALRVFVTYSCRFGLSFAYKVHREGLERVPKRGPLLLYANHSGLIEAPIFYTQLQPRRITGLGKAELWNNWFLSFIFWLWEVIPVHRGESDMDAMRKSVAALKNGWILGIAPEGKRDRDGALLPGLAGIVTMAHQSQAALIPIAHWGSLEPRRGLRRHFYMKAGRPFFFDGKGERITKEIRQAMTDEAMYQLAALLPERYRGAYSDLSKASLRYIRFAD